MRANRLANVSTETLAAMLEGIGEVAGAVKPLGSGIKHFANSWDIWAAGVESKVERKVRADTIYGEDEFNLAMEERQAAHALRREAFEAAQAARVAVK